MSTDSHGNMFVQFCLSALELLGKVVYWVVYWVGFALVCLILALGAYTYGRPHYAIVVYTKGDMVVPEWYYSHTNCQKDSLLKYPQGGCIDAWDDKWTFVERYR